MDNKNALALVGEDTPRDVLAALFSLGFELCVLPRHPRLAVPVASHADMLFFHADGKLFCPREYIKGKKELKKQLTSHGYKIIKCRTRLSATYPDDIAFNFAALGTRVFGRVDKMAKKMSKYLQRQGFEQIKVKQGYAKCSAVLLGNKAAITADKHIANAMQACGADVLRIENSQNAVKLDGYDYGFIGGACGVFESTVYFTGSLDLHPNGAEIEAFCKSRGFDIILLSQNQLTDIGGIIFLPDIS